MNYLHPQNRDIPFVDWRSPEKRKQGFLLWLDWRLTYNDLDHYMPANIYRDATGDKSPTGKPMTEEQTLWYCLIFGCTYQTEMAWAIYWNFPDFWKIDIDEMQKWNVETLDKQRYARDTKYNKGRIAEQVASMQKIIGPFGSIRKWIDAALVDDENQSFINMFIEASKIYKYGRMTTWLFLQALYETANISVKPDTMLATDSSNWSVRSGLLYLYNRDDIIEAKTKKKISKDDMKFVGSVEQDLYAESREYISEHNRGVFSNFLLESHLCQYKKLMLGGDYGGHSSGDHYSRGSWLAEQWGGVVNYDVFFEEVIPKHHPIVQRKRESLALRDLCKKTGQLVNMHEDYDYLPNMYLETGMNPDWFFEKDTHEAKAVNCIDNYGTNLWSKT